MDKIEVLVVDDQIDACIATGKDTLIRELNKCMEEFISFHELNEFNVDQVFNALEKHSKITLLLLDIMNGLQDPDAGFTLFEQLRKDSRWENNHHIQVIFFSKEATDKRHAKTADFNSLNLAGFLKKNLVFSNPDEACEIFQAAHERACYYRRYPTLLDPIRSECNLIYSPNSHAMQEVWEKILLAGRSMETVLIQGETGTGKELVADAIFQVMKKKSEDANEDIGSLIAYNIASAPTEGNLLYLELFGALKGAYSEATADRTGLFERASKNKAPIFLDEIGDAPLSVQIALLRVVQNKEVVPLGAFASKDNVVRELDYMRLITASNIDLPKAVGQGKFRADLYYRLKTIRITLPPLRERKDDIPVLTYHFIDKLNKKYQTGIEEYIRIDEEHASEIFSKLENYPWPGNVRELEGVIRTSYVLSKGKRFELAKEKEWMDDLSKDDLSMTSSSCVTSWEQPCDRPNCPRSPERILRALEDVPCDLPELKSRYGVPTTRAVVELLKKEYLGKKLNDAQCQRYFGKPAEHVRKWIENNSGEKSSQ
ncbi:MAG: sigma-54-dependent Fis family transcriptional regulator [Candidatus Competibacteraceae bacterium]|nr:sigma-54-dependent Fis family transcriptional regulator [Candidatus Competibacteraceae bacterium]